MNRQNIQVRRIAYPNQSLDSALAAGTNQQLNIHTVTAVNGSAAANNIAIAHSLAPSTQVITTVVGGVSSTPTLPLSAATSIIGTTNGDSITFQYRGHMSMITVNVTQAATGSPVYAYQYWNGAWVTLTTRYVFDFTSTGTKTLLFDPPIDWIQTTALGDFQVRVVATTAPGTAIKIDQMKMCRVISYRENVPSKGEVLTRFDEDRKLLLQNSDQIVPFFAYPSASNSIEATYQLNP